jgi:serine/threonine-protein kinase
MRWVASALPPLAAAHAQGIVHRDLKPANLFIARAADGSEQLKLLDFGLARDTRQKSRTETGVALGTPYYMSPEQAIRPKEVGPASDVWALGVMMYEVLSGHMPFDGETLHAVVLQSTTRPHVPLATHRPELDPALCELVEECLQKEPDARPHDASALLARLYPLLADEHICRQLDAPISMAQLARGSRNVDQISYADTAITLPAPRLDESEASYAPRRRAQNGALVPIALTALLLGAGAFGYLKYAPTAPDSTAPATAVLPSQSPTPAAASRDSAPQTPTSPQLEPSPTTPAAAEEERADSHASTLRDARGPAAKLINTTRRPTRGKKSEPTHALPSTAARAPSDPPRAEAQPETTEEAPLEQEPLPAPPPKDAPWDQAPIDNQVQGPQDPGQLEPPQAAVDTNSPPPATAEPSPAVGPEGSIEAPAAPVPEVDSLPPPEPPASP